MEERGLTKTQVANTFCVKAPSVSDWLKYGRIARKHLPLLVEVSGRPLEYWIDDTIGTSFATPVIARRIAEATALYGSDPKLIKLMEIARMLSPTARAQVLAHAEAMLTMETAAKNKRGDLRGPRKRA